MGSTKLGRAMFSGKPIVPTSGTSYFFVMVSRVIKLPSGFFLISGFPNRKAKNRTVERMTTPKIIKANFFFSIFTFNYWVE